MLEVHSLYKLCMFIVEIHKCFLRKGIKKTVTPKCFSKDIMVDLTKILVHLNDIFETEIDLKKSHGLLFQGHISHFKK